MTQTPNGKAQSTLASQASPSAVGEGPPNDQTGGSATDLRDAALGLMKERAQKLHKMVYALGRKYPHVPEFDDDGELHDAIHDLLRVHTPTALSSQAPKPASAVGELQDRVAPWMQECFGPVISADRLERSDRFIEESLELVQACGYEKTRAHALVEYVYGRPIGHAPQEVGGVMVTLAALCLAHGFNMHEEGAREVDRISEPAIIEKIRAKQASKPTGSALPIAAEADTANEPFDEGEAMRDADGMDGCPFCSGTGMVLEEVADSFNHSAADRLAPIEARGAVTDAERGEIAYSIQCRNRHADLPTVRFWVDAVCNALRARESAPVQQVGTVKLLAAAVTAISHLRYAVLRRANERYAIELSGSVSEQLLAEIKRLGR